MGRIIEKIVTSKTAGSRICFSVILPNGYIFQNKSGIPTLSIQLTRWSNFISFLFFGTYAITSGYCRGVIIIDGDLRQLGYLINSTHVHSQLKQKIASKRHPGTLFERVLNRVHMAVTKPSTRTQAESNATFHYGYDPEFYRLYLGETRAYSTAIWQSDTHSLEEAQADKWRLILNKLCLKPGMKIASLGSGFGYGELMAALEYGVFVDCYNVTKSQNTWLRAESKRLGVANKIAVFDCDYRSIKTHSYQYDALLLIESIEHVGRWYRRAFIEDTIGAMKDDAVGVIQWLSFSVESDVELFIRRHLYPGVDMPPLDEMITNVVIAGGEIQDLLCLRRHYHYTLNEWYSNFIKNYERIQAINPKIYTDELLRTWKLYLASGAQYLAHPDATARLYQLTFTKGTTTSYPMSFDFSYREGADTRPWLRGQVGRY